MLKSPTIHTIYILWNVQEEDQGLEVLKYESGLTTA